MSTEISRRSVTKGAAWSVPAVTVAASAPALAASPVSGLIYSVPWSNTYSDFQNTTGHDGMYLPYVMYPLAKSNATGTFTQSSPATAGGQPLYQGGTAGSYPSTATTTSQAYPSCVGLGSVITITMTELSGPTLPTGTKSFDTVPTLIPRDGNAAGGCGNYFSVTSSGGQTATNSNQFYGVSTTPGTWTWTLLWNASCTSSANDGCSAITYDIHVPDTVNGTSTNPISWSITTVSPAGTNTFTTTPHK